MPVPARLLLARRCRARREAAAAPRWSRPGGGALLRGEQERAAGEGGIRRVGRQRGGGDERGEDVEKRAGGADGCPRRKLAVAGEEERDVRVMRRERVLAPPAQLAKLPPVVAQQRHEGVACGGRRHLPQSPTIISLARRESCANHNMHVAKTTTEAEGE